MRDKEFQTLQASIEALEARARVLGLDFFDMRYEICPADVVYTISGFGMPTRYSHWSFGKQFARHKLEFDFGLSRIYELVVNNDPCYAFFLENNSLIQNQMIAAHVLAHSDFFKNNARFRHTSPSMMDTMAQTRDRFRNYEMVYGAARVEQVIDAAMSIQEHVDNSLRGRKQVSENEKSSGGRVTELPSKDLLSFLVGQSPILEDWERDIVATVREEMLYFWPQLETKIMNEGWATYWHNELMRELPLPEADALEFARMTSSVTAPQRFSLNPYNVGLAIWQHIEREFGRDAMFEIREDESDTGFLRNFLTQDIVDKCQLYLYEKRGLEWVIVERDVKTIRDILVNQRTNGGFPTLLVEEPSRPHATLLLRHVFEGLELDSRYVEKTLPMVQRLWGGPVELVTVIGAKDVRFACDASGVAVRAS